MILRAVIIVENQSNAKRESKIYIVSKKGNEEGGMEKERGHM